MPEVAAPGKHSPPAYSRWPSPADRPPERTRFHSAVRARSLAHSMMPGLSGTPPSSRGPRKLDARASPGTRESPPISFLSPPVRRQLRGFPIVSIRTGGRLTSVTIAASRPRLRTSCNPILNELNCPRDGSGFTTSDAPFAYTTGANAASFLPATTTTRSTCGSNICMAAERNVPLSAVPAGCGGHGSNACSRPMCKDSPAARITPQKLGVRPISHDNKEL